MHKPLFLLFLKQSHKKRSKTSFFKRKNNYEFLHKSSGVYMIQNLVEFKKTFNKNMSSLKTVLVKRRAGFYLFLKVNWVFISNKIKQKNKIIKNFNKKTIKKFKNLLKTLNTVYIALIKQTNFKKTLFLSKMFVKKLFSFMKNIDCSNRNINCFVSPKNKLTTKII